MGSSADSSKRLIVGEVPLDFDARSDLVLGPWCFIGREDAVPGWESLQFEPDPFKSAGELAEASQQTVVFAQGLIPELAARLNQAHGIRHSEEFWRLMILPWLITFVQTTFERQCRVNQALVRYGDDRMRVELLAESVVWSFQDTNDFLNRGVFNPVYNHWLFSRLLEAKIPNSWSVSYSAVPDPPREAVQQRTSERKRKLKAFLGRMRCSGVYGIDHIQALLWSFLLTCKPVRSRRIMPDARESRQANIDWNIDIRQLIDKTIPKCYLQLDHLGSEKLKPRMGKIRLTGPSLYYEEIEKYRLAQYLEGGEKIICTQHGGNFGNAKVYPLPAEIEYKHDAFFSWGWSEQEDYGGNIVPLPSPYLAKFRGRHKVRDSALILVGTCAYVLSYRLDAMPQPLDQLTYRTHKMGFLGSLRKEIFDSVLYRPYDHEAGSLRDRGYFVAKFPQLNICSGGLKEFHKRIVRCKLLVLDHPGTTLNIALAANIPTVCFWEERAFPMCRQAQPYFDELRRTGMLFSSGIEAAAAVNAIWHNVADWWQQERVQAARMSWCTQYARTKRIWWWEWAKALWKL